MSRRLFGWALVIGFGVLNGYTTFKPAFEARELEKLKEEERAASDLGPNMMEIPAMRNHTTTLLDGNAEKSKAS
ncbi:hypothetical protein A1O7_09482 [Cladophialophora yegresii CBS 114405]|uniref:Uncharacterized protein n=1 Tax=Cladophialophora yegresii CBS 114405 TaxID=1182544 RepID=W9VMB5_9EURO|nr:uncharacterized protein A1O7_09482 [Cladophialophora yegresii CBS 114405]EXJ54145.1 hypothetical protein A1O7_09482 [Cladophialophora yegresii CBS 114405]